ncbi:hypothetical protein LWI29_029862 [Acer saccharum]|uniref:Phospholipase A1 n=1 Tax=Acer saccharum TaxID=4024 RepID=A0AA39SI60_ACESA|nr:hypothetical protein LWI29_029862 [Acer saccharum]
MSGDTANIARRWKELSGSTNWNNMLQPLDKDLRPYIIHYGERAQATYDTFIFNKISPFAGDSSFSKKHLFERTGLTKANPFKYEVTKFLYATSSIGLPEAYMVRSSAKNAGLKNTNWIGYVAVATDEGKAALGRRDIVIAWRGTIQVEEWLKDFDFPLVPAAPALGDKAREGKMHRGFLSVYTSDNPLSQHAKTSAKEQSTSEVKKLLDKYKNEEVSITVTGHSLGGALATISAADIALNGLNKVGNKTCPVTAFGFASPKIGDKKLADILNAANKDLHILLIRNIPDIVPASPVAPGYTNAGEELTINTLQSDFLSRVGNVAIWHDLEIYLHGIAGTQGSQKPFKLAIPRDISLVNKQTDALKENHSVPGSWWVSGNRGMTQGNDGKWTLNDHEKDDDKKKKRKKKKKRQSQSQRHIRPISFTSSVVLKILLLKLTKE